MFGAMRSAVEEVISIQSMLCSLVVHVTQVSLICGDNASVIMNSTVKESLLKKKHVAISYYEMREAATAGIVHPIDMGAVSYFATVLSRPQNLKICSAW